MTLDVFEESLVAMLSSLSPHLEEAEELIRAIEAGIDEETLLELYALIAKAVTTVKSSERMEALDGVKNYLSDIRKKESLEKNSEDLRVLVDLNSGFP